MRLDKKINIQKLVKIRVPQGFFIALILFMLFTNLLFKILIKKEKKTRVKIRSYIEDGFLIAKVLKKVISIIKIQEIFAKINLSNLK